MIDELIKGRDKIIHCFHACEATKSNGFGFANKRLHGDFKQETRKRNMHKQNLEI